jgi:hypothetical protein
MSLLSTLSWWVTNGILLDNSTDSSFFLLTPLDHTPYTCRRPLYNNDDDFRLFCGMMDGLAFLPVPALTIGIHLLRTLCPDDPPEAAELLDVVERHQTKLLYLSP